MDAQRIILVEGSRLLGEMLRTVIHKDDRLELVQKVHSFQELCSVIDDFGPDWVVLALPVDQDLPGWVDHFLEQHPFVRLMAIFAGTGKIRMKWLETREAEVDDTSLTDVLQILESRPQRLEVAPKQSEFVPESISSE